MAETASMTNSPAPVMDVVAPPVEKAEKPEKAAAEVDPLEQLAAEDQKTQQAEKPRQTRHDKAAPREHPAQTAKNASGVGGAIVATVIIVLGLAALATYAYLQTNK